MTAKPSKNAFFFVLVVVFLDMIGFGLIVPVMPDLLSELTGQSVEEAVQWAGPIMAVYALMNFMFGPILGGLSDRYGRRPVILISVATLALDFLVMGLATSIWMLFAARMLSGISGATLSSANAYIADVTDKESRGKAFGMMGAAFGLGFTIGPGLGGLLGQIDSRAPFFAAAALSSIGFFYGLFVMPESLKEENRRAFDIKRANPFGAFKHFSKLPHVSFLFLAVGLYMLAHHVFPSTWSYYGAIRFGWSSAEIGATLMIVGIMSALVQGGLTGRIIKKIGAEKTAFYALCITITAMICYGLANQPWMIYVLIPCGAFGGLVAPALSTILSSRTPANAQGELQGANAGLQSLSSIIAPLVMTQTLHAFSGNNAPVYFPGAAFILAACLAALAIIPLRIGLKRQAPIDEDSQEAPESLITDGAEPDAVRS